MKSNSRGQDAKTYFLERMNTFEKEKPVLAKDLLGQLLEWGAAVSQYNTPAYAFLGKYHSLPPDKREAFLENVWNQGEFKTEETLADMVVAQIEYQARQQKITPKEVIDTLFANNPGSFMMLLQVPHTGIEYKPGSGHSDMGAALEMICALEEP